MKRSLTIIVTAAICAMLCTQASVARANGLTIFPLKADLSPQVRTAAFNVVSGEAAPMLMQIHLFTWTQADGIDVLTPSDELLVGPPIFTLQPAQTQLIRVGLRDNPAENRETAYRIVIGEVPTGQRTGLTFAFRLSMPIFVSPATPSGPHAAWSVVRSDASHLRFTLHNDGDQHFHLVALRIEATPGGTPLVSGSAIAYVLADQWRSWNVSNAKVGGAHAFRIEATTEGGALLPPAYVTVP
jgi:fimbrial chaperone protein